MTSKQVEIIFMRKVFLIYPVNSGNAYSIFYLGVQCSCKRDCSIDCKIAVKDLVCISEAVAPGRDMQLMARNRAIFPDVTA